MATTSLFKPAITPNLHRGQPYGSQRFLICFDTTCNRTRRKLGRTLLTYGHRVQKSVFECVLEPFQHKALQRSIERVCAGTQPNIRWYRLRPMDAKRIDVLGVAVTTDWPAFYIV